MPDPVKKANWELSLSSPDHPEPNSTFLVLVEVIKTLQPIGEISLDVLYDQVKDRLTLEQYRAVIATLVRSALVKESENTLYWIGK